MSMTKLIRRTYRQSDPYTSTSSVSSLTCKEKACLPCNPKHPKFTHRPHIACPTNTISLASFSSAQRLQPLLWSPQNPNRASISSLQLLSLPCLSIPSKAHRKWRKSLPRSPPSLRARPTSPSSSSPPKPPWAPQTCARVSTGCRTPYAPSS